MNNHYYTEQPTSHHHREVWQANLGNRQFEFVTDNGVFSKKTVDYGSQVLLRNFQDNQCPTGAILDMGCGYGPIGLALACQTGRHIEMVDINQRAVDLAKENSQRNRVNNVTIYQSNLFTKVERQDFAAIVTNPPIRAGKQVVHQILQESHQYLKKDGCLVVVIQKKQGAPSAAKKMEAVFGNVTTKAKDKGYYILVSYKK